MKHFNLMVLLILLMSMFATTVSAQNSEAVKSEAVTVTDISAYDNVLYIGNAGGMAGDTVKLDVKLKNVLRPVGCSFKLTLPTGWTLAKDDKGAVSFELADRASKMVVGLKGWEDGSYDCALIGTSAISGNDGTVISFRLIIPDNASLGNYEVRLTKISVQTKGVGMTKDHALPNVETTFTVQAGILGDVNGDGDVTPSDAILILYNYFGVELASLFL